MKQLFKSLVYAAVLFASGSSILADCGSGDCCSVVSSCDSCCNSCGDCTSLYLPRPQIDNLAFLMAGAPPYVADRDSFTTWFYAGYHFDRSMDGSRNTIANCLLGNNSVQFLGSVAADTATTSTCATVLIADYVGMGVETDYTWTPCPRIQSNNLDLFFHFGFDNWVQGLWLDIRFPIQWARWQLDLNSTTTGCGDCNNDCASACGSCDDNCCGTGSTGTLDDTAFNAGYMNHATATADDGAGDWAIVTTTPSVATATSVQEAMGGDFVFGDMKGFRYSKWVLNSCCTETKLADVSFDLGYDFYACDDAHFAMYVRLVAPTGTEINSCYAQTFFAPLIGNGHHVELGAGIRAHKVIWDCNDRSKLIMKFDGYATHLFAGDCQVRTFDFADKGCLSRYMLLKQFSSTSADRWVYDDTIISGVDYATRGGIAVTIPVKGEAVLKFEWSWCNWVFGLGTEVWGRSAEQFCNVGDPISGLYNPQKRYGFKGGTGVTSTGYTVTGNVINDTIVPLPLEETGAASGRLSATASNATASTIGDVDNAVLLANPHTGTGARYVDYRVFNGATVTADTTTIPLTSIAQDSSITNPIISASTAAITADTLHTEPVLLPTAGDNALDLSSGASPSQFTGKIFGDISYRWADCCWQPELSVYGMGEFAPCKFSCALSQWSVGVRLGVTY